MIFSYFLVGGGKKIYKSNASPQKIFHIAYFIAYTYTKKKKVK
jgi:hypothetical protein